MWEKNTNVSHQRRKQVSARLGAIKLCQNLLEVTTIYWPKKTLTLPGGCKKKLLSKNERKETELHCARKD